MSTSLEMRLKGYSTRLQEISVAVNTAIKCPEMQENSRKANKLEGEFKTIYSEVTERLYIEAVSSGLLSNMAKAKVLVKRVHFIHDKYEALSHGSIENARAVRNAEKQFEEHYRRESPVLWKHLKPAYDAFQQEAPEAIKTFAELPKKVQEKIASKNPDISVKPRVALAILEYYQNSLLSSYAYYAEKNNKEKLQEVASLLPEKVMKRINNEVDTLLKTEATSKMVLRAQVAKEYKSSYETKLSETKEAMDHLLSDLKSLSTSHEAAHYRFFQTVIPLWENTTADKVKKIKADTKLFDAYMDNHPEMAKMKLDKNFYLLTALSPKVAAPTEEEAPKKPPAPKPRAMLTLEEIRSEVFSVLVDNETTLFYALKGGKPSHKEMLKWGEVDKRARVTQSRQKGPTCWYYAYDRIRQRIGPKHSPEFAKARDIEVKCSTLRKQLTAFHEKLKLWRMMFDSCSMTARQDVLNRLASAQTQIMAMHQPTEVKMQALKTLTDFSEQKTSDRLSDYLDSLMHRENIAVYENFFVSMGTTALDQCINEHCKLNPYIPESRLSFFRAEIKQDWAKKSEYQKHAHTQRAACDLVAKSYGFKSLKVKKDQPIDFLAKILRDHGPICADGKYGISYYQASPEALEEVAGLPVFGWRVSAERIGSEFGHVIVIIGVKKGGTRGGRVYFVDPNEPSVPGKHEKVYVMSYKSFLERGNSESRWFCHPRFSVPAK